MKLLHFFSCCTNSTVIEDPPSKTDDERLFDKELLRFYSFSTVKDNNSNIDDFYYCRDDYNNILKDINNVHESLWKTRILSYTIRNRQVFMHYDPYKMGFTYYSSESLPYYLLNIIAMKYVRVFHCYDFFMDNKQIYFDDPNVDDISESEEKNENRIPNDLYTIHYIEIDKKNVPITKGPFAKFKKNNDTYETIQENKSHKAPVVLRYKNKFIHGGSLYNFDFLKKEKKNSGFRSPIIDTMNGFSYKDFKALNTTKL